MTEGATTTASWRRTGPRDLRLSLVHAVLATVATVGLFVVVRRSAGADVMGSASALVSATGVVALVWSYAGLVLGLVVGTEAPRRVLRLRGDLLAHHRSLNLVVLGLMVAHLGAFALGTPGGSWLVALVPQTAPVGPVGFTVGVLSLYLAVLLGPTYYLRRRVGQRLWLVVHQLASLVYALALWHALVLGPDLRHSGPWRVLCWAAQVPLLALFAWRLRRPLRLAERRDFRLVDPRYLSGRFAALRLAATSGALVAAFVILCVALAALGPGLHASAR